METAIDHIVRKRSNFSHQQCSTVSITIHTQVQDHGRREFSNIKPYHHTCTLSQSNQTNAFYAFSTTRTFSSPIPIESSLFIHLSLALSLYLFTLRYSVSNREEHTFLLPPSYYLTDLYSPGTFTHYVASPPLTWWRYTYTFYIHICPRPQPTFPLSLIIL